MTIVPQFAVNDKVVFVSPFIDGIEYTVVSIQYMNENNEFVEEVTENFQYNIVPPQVPIAAIEAYLEAAVV
jgi:uncharacterized protein (DUF433 family)